MRQLLQNVTFITNCDSTQIYPTFDCLDHEFLIGKHNAYARSSQYRCSVKKGVLRNFAELTR